VEFGHEVFLAERAQGLITDYRVAEGNPTNHQVQVSLSVSNKPSPVAPRGPPGFGAF
jgi:hypothetical protein